MSTPDRNAFPPDEVRDDFVPKADYLSPEFARLEEEYLWPYVWQVACREEEIPEAGDFVVYEIVDESILLIRQSDGRIKAFHNVCPHRGRKLKEGAGRAQQLVCRFHGWRYGLDGENLNVVDRKDWGSCLSADDIKLKPVHVARWGGCVFINMAEKPEPFDKFIAPIPEKCDLFEFEKLRFKWYKTVKLDLNWKLCVEFFNEFYHMQQTHSQMLDYMNDYSNTGTYGRHGAVWYTNEDTFPLARSPRLPPRSDGKKDDMRELIYAFARGQYEDIGAIVSERNFNAAKRLLVEVPSDTPPGEVMQKYVQFQLEAAAADGSGWPENLTSDYVEASHADWHLFPNLVFIHGSIDGALWYRARPNGHDHNSCLFDIWSLERFGPGSAPPIKRQYFDNWRDGDVGNILSQDFSNVDAMRGLRSRAFKGSRPSPIQERTVSNFHRALREFITYGPRPEQNFRGGGPKVHESMMANKKTPLASPGEKA